MTPLYCPNFIPADEADELLSKLLALDWLQETEARREYFMSEEPRSYIYGREPFAREYHSKEYSPEVSAVQSLLNNGFYDYNVCFLNRYDNKSKQLGWHADDSPSMDGTHPIAVISLGSEREIWWRLQTATGITPESNRQLLGHGSLFVMPAGFQSKYHHRIPRCDRECGVRVSLTFRRYT